MKFGLAFLTHDEVHPYGFSSVEDHLFVREAE